MKKRLPNWTVLSILFILLILMAFISLRLGRYGMSYADIINTFGSVIKNGGIETGNKNDAILFSVRLPRIVMTILVGSALSLSGACYQGLFKNPMVSPDILGVSSGAGIGACVAILLSLSTLSTQLLAFASGLFAVLLVMAISAAVSKGTGTNVLVMVLAGTVVSSMCSGILSLIKYVADTDTKLPEITFWLMGSFSKTGGWRNVIFMLIISFVGSIPLLCIRWRINVLSFGEEDAKGLGVNTQATSIIIILCSTLLTASSVAMCGTIGWVGLIIPHISRFLVGSNYLSLLPCSMLSGAFFMLGVDTIARSLSSGEIPIGVLTSLIGAPIFIYLLFKSKRGWIS